MSLYHKTVLAGEACDLLQVKKGRIYIDATLGGGGHSEEIIKLGAFVWGLDWDQDALDFSQNRLSRCCLDLGKKEKDCFILKKGNFANLDKLYQLPEKPAGVLFDLGVSLHQLKTPERGFSFNDKGPLDMRMDRTLPVSAFDLVQKLSYGDLTYILMTYGEEKKARQIAGAIVSVRENLKIDNTTQLAEIISRVMGKKRGKIHPATKSFQAIRMAVNFEMDNLESGLKAAFKLLKAKGRLVVISFQPLEDQLVYKFIKDLKNKNLALKAGKPFKPSFEEQKNNPSARSAVIRAIEKI